MLSREETSSELTPSLAGRPKRTSSQVYSQRGMFDGSPHKLNDISGEEHLWQIYQAKEKETVIQVDQIHISILHLVFTQRLRQERRMYPPACHCRPISIKYRQ